MHAKNLTKTLESLKNPTTLLHELSITIKSKFEENENQVNPYVSLLSSIWSERSSVIEGPHTQTLSRTCSFSYWMSFVFFYFFLYQ